MEKKVKTEEEKITDTQLIKALEENEGNIIPPVLNKGMDFRILQKIFSRSLALLMLSLVLATGILVSSVSTSFIATEHSFVIAAFKIFCLLASLGLILINIFLVFRIITPENGDPNPRNTLREYY